MIERNSAALWTELNGQMLFMNIGNGSYFEATGIASAIWELLEQPSTFDDLVAAIVARYQVAPEVCAGDARQFVDKLIAADLVTERGEAAGTRIAVAADSR